MLEKVIVVAYVLIFALGVALLWRDTSPPQTFTEGAVATKPKEINNFFFTSLDGRNHALNDFRGKIVFVNSWFTRCPPCIKEMPEFLELAQRHPEDMVFIALSVDSEKETIERYISRLPKEKRALTKSNNVFFIHDEGSVVSRKLLGVKGFPETTIIDRGGYQLYKIKGVIDWLGAEVESIFSRQFSSNDQPREHTHDKL